MKSCKCESCGAEYLYSIEPLKYCLSCFSGNIHEVNKNYNFDKNLLGKATLTIEEFKKKVEKKLVQGDYTPDDIREKTKILECIRLYIPYYSLKVSYSANYDAEIGYYNKKDYVDYRTITDRNGNRKQEKVHRTRTEIKWQPYSGSIEGKKSYHCIASNNFNECAEFIDNVSQNKYVENRYDQNYVIERPKSSAEDILKENYYNDLTYSIKGKIQSKIPGDTSRRIKISSKYNIDSSKLEFKQIWIALRLYQGGYTFKYICDSEDIDNVEMIGDKPEDEERKDKIKRSKIPFIVMTILMGLGLISSIAYFILEKMQITNLPGIPLVGKLLFIGTILLGILSLIFGLRFKIKHDSIINDSYLARGVVLNDDAENIVDEDESVDHSVNENEGLSENKQDFASQIEDLRTEFCSLISPQRYKMNGARLKKILNGLFEILDIESDFINLFDEIDSDFVLNEQKYYFVSRWLKRQSKIDDYDFPLEELGKATEGTIGLFLSLNGFAPDVSEIKPGHIIILMDGNDLLAVLEKRIDFVEILEKKLEYSKKTGRAYLSVNDILTGRV
jgi:hypothetical protein